MSQRETGPSASRRGGNGKRMDIDDMLEGEEVLDFATERSAERRKKNEKREGERDIGLTG